MSLGPWEIALIVLVIFLLFGATRLPNAARSLGRSMRIFKSEMDEMKNDTKEAKSDQAIASRPASQPSVADDLAQPQVRREDNVTDPAVNPEGRA